jgi:hypothetical protein
MEQLIDIVSHNLLELVVRNLTGIVAATDFGRVWVDDLHHDLNVDFPKTSEKGSIRSNGQS